MSISEVQYKEIVIAFAALQTSACSWFPISVVFITDNFQPGLQLTSSLDIFPIYEKKW